MSNDPNDRPGSVERLVNPPDLIDYLIGPGPRFVGGLPSMPRDPRPICDPFAEFEADDAELHPDDSLVQPPQLETDGPAPGCSGRLRVISNGPKGTLSS